MPYDTHLSTGDILTSTQVAPSSNSSSSYTASVAPEFVALSAQGGLLMGVALRAIELHVRLRLDRHDLHPVSAQAVYCEPVPAGEIDINVRILRSGRSITQASADVLVSGSESVAVQVTMTLGLPREGGPFVFDQREFPSDVQPLEALPDPVIPEPILEYLKSRPLFYQSDFKIAVGHQPWDAGWQAGPGRFAAWARMHNSPMLANGRFDPLCYPYLADLLAPAVLQAVGPEVGALLHTPTLNFDVQFLGATQSEWLLIHAQTQEGRDGFGHGTVELWSPEGQLLAIASQRALLRTIA